MIVVPPVAISAARVVSSTAAESEFGLWVAGTTYAQSVITSLNPTVYANAAAAVVTYKHRDYESKKPANTGYIPDVSPDWWLDLGTSNRHRMFDYTRNSATSGASPLTVVVAAGQRVDSCVFFGLSADNLNLTITDALGNFVKAWTVSLRTRNTTRASEYFFGQFLTRRKVALLNLPPMAGATLTVTLGKTSGSPSVEAMCVGTAFDVGAAKYDLETDIIDFSVVDRKPTGELLLTPKKNVPKMTVTCTLAKARVNSLVRLREDYPAKPLVFLALTDDTDGYFDATAMLGIFKRMPLRITNAVKSNVNFDLEGL